MKEYVFLKQPTDRDFDVPVVLPVIKPLLGEKLKSITTAQNTYPWMGIICCHEELTDEEYTQLKNLIEGI